MSAGGLSYSALTSSRKVSLPSVDDWGTNMDIIKDPPKSIHTRRITKVGDTNSVTKEIELARDRAEENILKFARGVNPMVSVSYSNVGNNGGSGGGGSYPSQIVSRAGGASTQNSTYGYGIGYAGGNYEANNGSWIYGGGGGGAAAVQDEWAF